MDKKGSVLMISLWILAILVVFALGLGHRGVINLRLAGYQKGRLKATCLAKAGINRAIRELLKDNSDYDTLSESWSTGRDENNNNIFEDIEIAEGSGEKFSVRVTDEDAKININNADAGSRQLLVALLTDRNIEDADNLANTIIDWIDENNTNYRGEAENELFKNQPFAAPEELMLIFELFYEDEKKATDNYLAIKDFITVYTDGQVNINTASREILALIAKNINNSADAVSLAEKIINFRQADTPFTDMGDTGAFEQNLSPQEIIIFEQMKQQLKVKSNYFRIISQGTAGNINKKITVIYDRDNQKIIYWHEN